MISRSMSKRLRNFGSRNGLAHAVPVNRAAINLECVGQLLKVQVEDSNCSIHGLLCRSSFEVSNYRAWHWPFQFLSFYMSYAKSHLLSHRR